MKKDLIKAILCLAEGQDAHGDCLKINLRNTKRYKNYWKSLGCRNCPYMQTSYRIGGNVDSEEKNIWLKEVANIIKNEYEAKHFIEMEIEQTKKWLKEECFDCFNGVQVRNKQAAELNKKHIKFCEHILEMLEK